MIVPGSNEAPDEAAHVNMISFLKRNHRIPVFNNESEIIPTQYSQSLLSGAYYSMAYNSPLSYLPYLPLYTSKTEDIRKSAVLPDRVVSSLFVALFAVFLFLSLIKIDSKKEKEALVITIFISLIPQIIYSAAYINIEPPALFLMALSLYFYTRLAVSLTCDRRSPTVIHFDPNIIYFGISVGLLGLMKANYLIFVGFLVLLVIFDVQRAKTRLLALKKYIPVAILFVLINAWWWIRNIKLYHGSLIMSYIKREIIEKAPDWLQTPRMQGYNIITIFGNHNFAKFTFLGFFANLGGANIFLSPVFYVVFFIAIITLIILAFRSFKQYQKYLISFIVILVASLIYFANKNLDDFSPQGRHLFPLMVPLAIVLFIGLINLPKKLSKVANIFLPVFSILASLYGLFLTLDQYYIKGLAYANQSNMVKFLPDFSWRHPSITNYRTLYNMLELPPGSGMILAILFLISIISFILIFRSINSTEQPSGFTKTQT